MSAAQIGFTPSFKFIITGRRCLQLKALHNTSVITALHIITAVTSLCAQTLFFSCQMKIDQSVVIVTVFPWLHGLSLCISSKHQHTHMCFLCLWCDKHKKQESEYFSRLLWSSSHVVVDESLLKSDLPRLYRAKEESSEGSDWGRNDSLCN